MKSLRTYKLKIISEHSEFLQLAATYKAAANWLSSIIYHRKRTQTPNSLSTEFYGTIREKFKLPSQVTCSLFRHVVGSYRSMRKQGEWSLAKYTKNMIPIVWNRDFVLRQNGISIWKKHISYKGITPLPDGKWCDSRLKLIKKNWYLCLTIEIDVPDIKQTGTIIGVDRGQKNILCAVAQSNKTLYAKGSELNHKRLCIRRTRAKVASVGTRSAHRLLKRLSGREKAVTQQILHIASKQLVNFASSLNAKTIVLEDLSGFKKQQLKGNKEVHHKQRARNNRWPYALLEFFITYKAGARGIGIEHVSARGTSSGCPKCGCVSKSNRKGLNFRCIVCDYADNADRVGGMNISLRSLCQRLAVGERAMCQLAYSNNDENHELQAASL